MSKQSEMKCEWQGLDGPEFWDYEEQSQSRIDAMNAIRKQKGLAPAKAVKANVFEYEQEEEIDLDELLDDSEAKTDKPKTHWSKVYEEQKAIRYSNVLKF